MACKIPLNRNTNPIQTKTIPNTLFIIFIQADVNIFFSFFAPTILKTSMVKNVIKIKIIYKITVKSAEQNGSCAFPLNIP